MINYFTNLTNFTFNAIESGNVLHFERKNLSTANQALLAKHQAQNELEPRDTSLCHLHILIQPIK